MARHRDFDGPRPARDPSDPITFSIQGEHFTCLTEAPSGVLNDLVAGIQTDEKGQRVYSAPNLVAFVTGVLRETETVVGDDGTEAEVPTDDVERFLALVHDKIRIVPIEQLGELVLWLSQEFTGRPSGPSAR